MKIKINNIGYNLSIRYLFKLNFTVLKKKNIKFNILSSYYNTMTFLNRKKELDENSKLFLICRYKNVDKIGTK